MKIGDYVIKKGQPKESFYKIGGVIIAIEGLIAEVICDGTIKFYLLEELRLLDKDDITVIGTYLTPDETNTK